MDNPFLVEEETILPHIPDDENWHYCFVRHRIGNEEDSRNVVAHLSGKLPYELVTLDMLPKEFQQKFAALKVQQGQNSGHVQVADTTLARTPQRLYQMYMQATQIRADKLAGSLREELILKNAMHGVRGRSGLRIEDDNSEDEGLVQQPTHVN